MKRGAWIIAALCSFILAMGWVLPVAALSEPTDQQPVLIAELQTASAKRAGEKFVALYNPNDTALEVTGWELQYRAAHRTDDAPWKTTAAINCETISQPDYPEGCTVEIAAHGTLWLATYDLGADRPAHPLHHKGLATKGGQLRLVRPAQNDQPEAVQDMLGYGDAQVADGGHPAEAPPKGKSLKRRCSAGQCQATHNNGDDFYVEAPPTQNDQATPPASGSEPSNADAGQPPEEQQRQYPTIAITELLPRTHRSKPGADKKFIELYNPNGQPADLQDYVLQSGKGWKSHYTIADVTLQPHEYRAFFYDQTRLALNPKGGAVRLLNPHGDVISETHYDAAKAGYAWAQAEDGSWQWSASPTPAQANKFGGESTSEDAASSPASHHQKAPHSKEAKPPKTKAASAAKVKAASTKKSATKTVKPKTAAGAKSPPPLAQPAQSQPNQGINYWFIGAAAAIGGGYALYEYRQDIWGFMRKIKHKLKQE